MTEYTYLVVDLNYPFGVDFNTKQMIAYAKKMLSVNKRVHGLDRDVMSKDLDNPLNAWVYLKNIGIGKQTNRKKVVEGDKDPSGGSAYPVADFIGKPFRLQKKFDEYDKQIILRGSNKSEHNERDAKSWYLWDGKAKYENTWD